MPTTTCPTPIRCLVSSTAGRGPCEACGVLAELHLVESWRPFERPPAGFEAFLGTDALCLPCCERPELARAA